MAAATGTSSFINQETGDTYYLPTDWGGGGGAGGGFGGDSGGGFGGGLGGGFDTSGGAGFGFESQNFTPVDNAGLNENTTGGDFQFYNDPGVRADNLGSFPGDFSVSPTAEGKTSNYQGTETPFNPNVGAPDWLKSLLGIASVIPTPIQPLAAAANVATNLYDANARGTSLLPSLAGVAGLLGQPVLAAGINAYNQYDQGNTIGAGLTGLAALGAATGNPELGQLAGQIGGGLNAYNAVQGGDYLTAALSAAGALDPSVAREANALNSINRGIESGNMAAVLAGASTFAQSPDLMYAAQGAKLLESASKNDWGAISDIASSIKQGASNTFADIRDVFSSPRDTMYAGLQPWERDSLSMNVGPRDEIGYTPDPSLVADYAPSGGGGAGVSTSGTGADTSTATTSTTASAPQTDVLAALGLSGGSQVMPGSDYDLSKALSSQRQYQQAVARNRQLEAQIAAMFDRNKA